MWAERVCCDPWVCTVPNISTKEKNYYMCYIFTQKKNYIYVNIKYVCNFLQLTKDFFLEKQVHEARDQVQG